MWKGGLCELVDMPRGRGLCGRAVKAIGIVAVLIEAVVAERRDTRSVDDDAGSGDSGGGPGGLLSACVLVEPPSYMATAERVIAPYGVWKQLLRTPVRCPFRVFP